jgi:hypothetical protein
MSLKQLSFSSQQPSSSTGSNELPISIGQHKWLRRLFAAVGLYLLLLPVWWFSLPLLSTLSAHSANLIYHLFDPQVAIRPAGRAIDFTITASEASGFGGQRHEETLQTNTITYGLPMLVALILATGASSWRARLQALLIGMLILCILTVPAVMLWAKLASLTMDEKIARANMSASGDRASFLFYALHGYAFSQPVMAVIVWLGLLMLGFFTGKPADKMRHLPAVARNANCPCGSRRKYKRCCGRK